MNIQENISLKPYNTFGLDANSQQFVSVISIEELQKVLQSEKAKSQPLFVLGGGSNILLTKDVEGLTLKVEIEGIEVVEETDNHVLVKVGAGVVWHDFVLYSLAKDWGGIENLSLIPGTVGAAPMQNIGAYGVEIKEVFEKLHAVNRITGEIEVFDKDACQFGYRESIFKNTSKNKYVIAEVYFRLTKQNHHLNTTYGAIEDTLKEMGIKNPTIQDVSRAVIAIRQSKLPDPKKIGNSGSFFKNPTIDKIDYEQLKIDYPDMPGYQLPENMVKVPAGWLIEQCGWKGFRENDIGIHKNQALVLVNYGGGRGNDLWQLAQQVQASVRKKFGIELSPEVNVI